MQTLYTKLTRERAPQFQQSTKIVEDNGKRLVIKEPLTEECNDHIRRMSENYTYFKNKGIENLCPVEYKDGKLFFTFLKGESFCDELLLLAEQKNREKFVERLLDYKKFVLNFGADCDVFYPTEKFKNVFGEINLSGKTAARKLNIDLIFENIIHTEKTYQVIDYEWIFDFLIPYEFVFYRAIHSFFIKYSGKLEGFIDKDTIYDVFGMRAEDRKIFQEMDENFLSYVYGKNLNYDHIICNYKQKAFPVEALIKKVKIITQLYLDVGNGFGEESSICEEHLVYKNEHVTLQYNLPEQVRQVRFDPSSSPIAIHIAEICVVNAQSERVDITEYRTNANKKLGGDIIFYHDDPQIIFDKVNNIKTLNITFQIITVDNSEIQNLLTRYKIVENENALIYTALEKKHIKIENEILSELEETKKTLQEDIEMLDLELKNGIQEIEKLKKMNDIYLEIIKGLKNSLLISNNQ